MASCCRHNVQLPYSACEVHRCSLVKHALVLAVVILTICITTPCPSFVPAPTTRSTRSLPTAATARSAKQGVALHGPVFRYRAVGAGAVMGAMGAAIRWKPWAGAPAILRTWSIHSLLSFAYLIVMLVDLRTVLLPGKWHSSGFPVLVDLLQEPDIGFARLVGYMGVAVSLLGWARLDAKTSDMKRATVDMAVLWNIVMAISLDSNFCFASGYSFDVFHGHSQIFVVAVVLALLIHSLYATWCFTRAPLKDRQSMYGMASSDEVTVLFLILTTLLPMWAEFGPQTYNMLSSEVSVHLPQHPELLGYHANVLRVAVHTNNLMMFGMSLRRYNAISDWNASLIFGGVPFLYSLDISFYVADLWPKLLDAGLISTGANLSVVVLFLAGTVVMTFAKTQNQHAQESSRIRL